MNSVLLFVGVIFAAQLVTTQNLTYRAGVVEFQTRRVGTGDNLANETATNLRRFLAIIGSTDVLTVDILVFPEGVLNFPQTAVRVPRVRDNISACNNQSNDPLIQALSCAAISSRTYITVQLYMSVNCTEDQQQTNDTRPCTHPRNNTNIYNAAVVFNRQGVVIATYRKFNLFNEPGVRRPHRPDNTTFNTDFGVTFGVFICFDILFDAPANHLVNNGIRHFVYPTMWFSELPYLTAIQTQQMWSHRNNVNLLAAGANNPRNGNTGSGIYSGRMGPLVFEFSNSPITRLITAQVARNPRTSDEETPLEPAALEPVGQDSNLDLGVETAEETAEERNVLPGLDLWRQRLNSFNTRFLNFTRANATRDMICINNNNRMCCEYDIAVTLLPFVNNTNSYSYAIAVFNGHTPVQTGGPQRLHATQMICSLVACTRFGQHASCGLRFNNTLAVSEPVRFERLILTQRIITGNNGRNATIIMANTLHREIVPLPPSGYQATYSTHDSNQNQSAVIRLVQPRDDIRTFALFARNSLQDFNSGKMIAVNGMLLLVLSAFVMIFNQ